MTSLAHRTRTLCALALERLPRLVDASTGLVVHRADGDHLAVRGTSPRYTAMSAIGLAAAGDVGLASPRLDAQTLVAALDRVLPTLANSGDVGLVLWAATK